jgi:hypothetical protein
MLKIFEHFGVLSLFLYALSNIMIGECSSDDWIYMYSGTCYSFIVKYDESGGCLLLV